MRPSGAGRACRRGCPALLARRVSAGGSHCGAVGRSSCAFGRALADGPSWWVDRRCTASARVRGRSGSAQHATPTSIDRHPEVPDGPGRAVEGAGSGWCGGLRPFDEPRQERRPAALVPVSPGLAFGAERLPATMLDRDPGPALARRLEADLDLGRVRAIPAEVPEVAEPARRLPDRDLAPVMLEPARRPFE